eukprot:1154099-Pelagomonas_calceolata.AAC.2
MAWQQHGPINTLGIGFYYGMAWHGMAPANRTACISRQAWQAWHAPHGVCATDCEKSTLIRRSSMSTLFILKYASSQDLSLSNPMKAASKAARSWVYKVLGSSASMLMNPCIKGRMMTELLRSARSIKQ